MGRGVSVGMIVGVTGDGVTVNVGETVFVGFGLAIGDGATEIGVNWAVAGAQALRKRRAINVNSDELFIFQIFNFSQTLVIRCD